MSDKIKSLGKHVIVATDEKNVRTYLGFDSNSGGYPYWSTGIRGCAQLSLEEAMKHVEDMVAKMAPEHASRSTDGTIYPHSDINGVLNLSNVKRSGKATLTVERLMSLEVCSFVISGEIKRPTGFTY